MFLPHLQALTILANESFKMIMSAACFATSVPVIPIANPTSAFFRAGASFVPSPVTATTSPNYLSPVTSKYLSSGHDHASTLRCSLYLANSSLLETTSASPAPGLSIPPTFLANSGPVVTSYSENQGSGT
jgi:hypothetical protein